jgi:hypothetical protein
LEAIDTGPDSGICVKVICNFHDRHFPMFRLLKFMPSSPTSSARPLIALDCDALWRQFDKSEQKPLHSCCIIRSDVSSPPP